MKRFMYLSIGVLCLSLSALVGSHIGNRTAEAVLSSPTRNFDTGIVAYRVVGSRRFALDEFGSAWEIYVNTVPGGNFCWERVIQHDPHLPLDQIKYWEPRVIISTDNHLWVDNGESIPQWEDCGVWPGGTVETQQQSWGSTKTKYNAEGN